MTTKTHRGSDRPARMFVLVARYGGGPLAGLVAMAITCGVTAVVTGAEFATTWSRLASIPNLVAFGACLAVSGVTSWHLWRQAQLRERLSSATQRAVEAETTLDSLRTALESLRASVDRAS